MRYFETVARLEGHEDRTRFPGWKLEEVERIALRTYGESASVSIFDHHNESPYGFRLVAVKDAGRVRFQNF